MAGPSPEPQAPDPRASQPAPPGDTPATARRRSAAWWGWGIAVAIVAGLAIRFALSDAPYEGSPGLDPLAGAPPSPPAAPADRIGVPAPQGPALPPPPAPPPPAPATPPGG